RIAGDPAHGPARPGAAARRRARRARARARPRGVVKLEVEPAVAAAIAAKRAVVALESTVIAHGLPRPLNLETAIALEDEVRAGGATPATIAVASGNAVVGADRALLSRLANEEGVAKVSTRDVAPLIAGGGLGATTVAATVEIAAQAGISVMATGGIGGVHREAEAEVDRAIAAAEREGIRGAALTPYLLGALGAATSGKSLRANVSLLRQNARIATQIALALAA